MSPTPCPSTPLTRPYATAVAPPPPSHAPTQPATASKSASSSGPSFHTTTHSSSSARAPSTCPSRASIPRTSRFHRSAQCVFGTSLINRGVRDIDSPERFTAADGSVYEWQIRDARPQVRPSSRSCTYVPRVNSHTRFSSFPSERRIRLALPTSPPLLNLNPALSSAENIPPLSLFPQRGSIFSTISS